jgi:hypothetical protein
VRRASASWIRTCREARSSPQRPSQNRALCRMSATDASRRASDPVRLDRAGPRGDAPGMPQTALDRAIALWGAARIAIAASRRARAAVATARRGSATRRTLRLATGANDEASRPPARDRHETWTRRCPRCQRDVIEPVGRATAEGGLVKIDLWCRACNYPFTFLRRPRD